MQPQYIYFETYGCCANQNNTEIMKGLCLQAGLEITNNPDIADIIIINTCIVKEPTEKRIERRISDLRKKYKDKPIIVAGCMPEVRAEKLTGFYLLGTHHVKNICKLIRKIYENKYNKEEFLEKINEIKLCLPKIPGKEKIGITQISEGCNNNCSFCIVRLAKHKLFSYPEEKILENIKNDIKSGAKEIWITSQDNANYGLDSGKQKLPELMSKILEIKGKFKIRIGMMNPENLLPILDDMIKIYKHKKMKPFLHLPLQSGTNKILKKMNRNYSVKDFLKIVHKFKEEIPDLFLSTDIIAGFPGENDKDFQKSVEIIKQIKPQQLNLSRYGIRKGTSASKMKQVPADVAKNRARKLMNLYSEIGFTS